MLTCILPHHTSNYKSFFCSFAPGEEHLCNLAHTPPPSSCYAHKAIGVKTHFCVYKSISLHINIPVSLTNKEAGIWKIAWNPWSEQARRRALFVSSSLALLYCNTRPVSLWAKRRFLSIITWMQFFCDLTIYLREQPTLTARRYEASRITMKTNLDQPWPKLLKTMKKKSFTDGGWDEMVLSLVHYRSGLTGGHIWITHTTVIKQRATSASCSEEKKKAGGQEELCMCHFWVSSFSHLDSFFRLKGL